VTGERWTALAFGVAIGAALGLAAVYWSGGQVQVEGALLGVTLGGIGLGVVVWGKYFMPDEEVEEERGPLESTDEEIAAFRRDFEEGEATVARRKLLVRMGGAAIAALGAALIFPIRSLGPRPGRGFKRTPYHGGGVRVVTADGSPVRPADLPVDGVITVWPKGHTDAADAPTLLIRVSGERLRLPARRMRWVPDGIVAYSKLCTHVGCPVGLYQAASGLLLCPCHQSTFDVTRGAEPVFGPATRPLPQLPLGVDDAGYLVALGDFTAPPGPGFWDRDR
jgi:ubiquinol-cytochrome c reductase iron-sulfur subunit